MQPIFNKKQRFYDYFPHLPTMRMRMDFHLGFYEQTVVRERIQKVIRNAYDHLVDTHDLKHATVYPEIGDEFDKDFYRELKTNCQQVFRNLNFWEFLEDIMPALGPEDQGILYFKLTSSLGNGITRVRGNGPVKLREAFVALINFDLDALTGQELLYLTKIS